MKEATITAPSTGLKGSVIIPGDKSISHRSVMFGALAKGTRDYEFPAGGRLSVNDQLFPQNGHRD